MTIREEVREYLNKVIDDLKTIESPRARKLALAGVLATLHDIVYELQLEVGEAAALEEIKKNTEA